MASSRLDSRKLGWYWIRSWIILEGPYAIELLLGQVKAGLLETSCCWPKCGWIMDKWTNVGSVLGWTMGNWAGIGSDHGWTMYNWAGFGSMFGWTMTEEQFWTGL